MRKIILISGIIIALICSIFILTGCTSSEDITKDKEDVTEKEEKEVVNEYSFEGLSFKLPSSFKETDSDSEDTVMYITDLKNDSMRMFSVGIIPSQGVDFIEIALEGLKEQAFELSGYEVVEKQDPQKHEYNGVKTISVIVRYKNTNTNVEAEVEYCYAQKDDTVFIICFQLFTQNGKKITDSEFATAFDDIKGSLKIAE